MTKQTGLIDKPKNCNECGRELKYEKDFKEINLREEYGGSFIYGQCQYCRANDTKKWKRKEAETHANE